MRILLVEDEPLAAQGLSRGLRDQAYAVDVERDGNRALYHLAISEFDLVILDVGQHGRNRFDVCRQLRSEGRDVPVLMLSARDAIEARVEGLDSGADDYLTKPFDFRELLARVRSLLRRRHPLTPAVIRVGPLELDTRGRQVRVDGKTRHLSAREFALLEYLALNLDTVVGRATLTEHVWEASEEPASNAIDVCVRRLRRKLDKRGRPSLIVTRRGEGYMLTAHTQK